MVYAFQNDINLYIVMEFVQGGELFNLMAQNRNGLGILEARFFIAEIVLAIEQLHKVKI